MIDRAASGDATRAADPRGDTDVTRAAQVIPASEVTYASGAIRASSAIRAGEVIPAKAVTRASDALRRSDALARAVSHVPPPGRWAVAVSGGADSVALLELLRHRPDLHLVVAHLDHETRAGGSAADAAYVRALASRWNLACDFASRSEIQPTIPDLPKNTSARYRAIRTAFFHRVITSRNLAGVLLAHHADDQAETILQRLLRGTTAPAGLAGMRPDTTVSGVRILRPLLTVRRATLRALLRDRHIEWREDPSNAAPNQQRNRVRMLLAASPALVDPLLDLARASAALATWLRDAAPTLADAFDIRALQNLPAPLAREAARRWLRSRAAPGVDIGADAADRLVEMATDAASPPRQHFPGPTPVHRRRGQITT